MVWNYMNRFANSLKHMLCFEAPQASLWLPKRIPTQKRDSQGDLWQWLCPAGGPTASVLSHSRPKHFVVSAQAPWRPGESLKLRTSSSPRKGCVVPLPELLLKTPLRVNASLCSHYDWGTSFAFPLTSFPLMHILFISDLLVRECHSMPLWGSLRTMFKT